MENDVLSLLKKQMQTEIEAVSQALVSSGARDFAEYTAMCGKVTGLMVAQRLVGDMQARLQHEDD